MSEPSSAAELERPGARGRAVSPRAPSRAPLSCLRVSCAVALLGSACDTQEKRAWLAREAELTRTHAELQELGSSSVKRAQAAAVLTALVELRRELDVATFLRTHDLAATAQGGGATLTVSRRGSVTECEQTLTRLAPYRWRFEAWRLRLGPQGCDWSAQTGPRLATVEARLDAPPRPRWTPPPTSWWSGDLSAVQRRVRDLEVAVARAEAQLGPLATALQLRDAVVAATTERDARKAAAPPCDLAIVRRELALDDAARGQLLEVEQGKLVHPLEPQSDLRLRGLVSRDELGALVWRCEAP